MAITIRINASFANNRNNGLATAKTPSINYDVGQFLVYTGLGGVIPYSASMSITLSGIVGTFVVGETVTGGTSAATGVVLAVAANGLVLTGVTGTFITAEVLTGGTSGATGTSVVLTTNDKILGLSNEGIDSTSSNFATDEDINVSTPNNVMDYLIIPVSSGSATSALVGTYVNVDPANPGAVDVSTPGTQILVTRVVDAGTIHGAIALSVAS